MKPPEKCWKLNTNGSYMSDHNKAGARGIVTNKNGDMVMAFAYPIQFYTNNFSEAQAALIGISWCCEQHVIDSSVELIP